MKDAWKELVIILDSKQTEIEIDSKERVIICITRLVDFFSEEVEGG